MKLRWVSRLGSCVVLFATLAASDPRDDEGPNLCFDIASSSEATAAQAQIRQACLLSHQQQQLISTMPSDIATSDSSPPKPTVLDPSDVNYDDPKKATPLIRAITASDKEQILALIAQGADVNVLHGATINPRVLRQHRQDGNVLRHPLDFAAARCRPEIFQLLHDHQATIRLSNPLHTVAGGRTSVSDANRTAMLDYLLGTLKLDINSIEYAQDPDSMAQWDKLKRDMPDGYGLRAFGTPLHKAAGSGWEAGVEYLLAKGADKTILDTEKSGTALDWQLVNEVGEGGYSLKIINLLKGT